MATILATTVIAHPQTHEPVVLLEGTEAPDWAVGAIGNPAVVEQGDTPAADGPGVGEDDTPAEDWRLEELKAYAEAHQIDLDGARSKADVLAAIEASESTDE